MVIFIIQKVIFDSYSVLLCSTIIVMFLCDIFSRNWEDPKRKIVLVKYFNDIMLGEQKLKIVIVGLGRSAREHREPILKRE